MRLGDVGSERVGVLERVLDREIRIEDHRRLLDQLLEEIDEERLRIES